ncbi:MAG: ferredoxin--NADP reductase [Deltaproteobacteria bacterium]|nr:ferredoxin--NADP reductase [Deltaproteobacteria bacterium]
MGPYELNSTITYKRVINAGLWTIRLKPDDLSLINFLPGQYAELGLFLPVEQCSTSSDKPAEVKSSGFVRRQYSIVSSPRDKEGIEFYLVLVPEGRLTPRLYELAEGDRLWIGPKMKGKFTMEEIPARKHLVMISTGTGIAPFISMLRHYRGQNRWEKLVLIHAARVSGDLGYREELTSVSREDKSVVYIPTVTREPQGSTWAGHRGRVQTLLEDSVYEKLVGDSLSADKCQVFMCGNPDMIEVVSSSLESKGFSKHSRKMPGNIHFERYW